MRCVLVVQTHYFAEIFFFLRIDLLLTIMASITDIIHIMNKEEIRQLKLFLNRTKTQYERKDVRLFDLLRKSSLSAEEDKIVKQLYGKADRNAYYRLRNRLLEDIGKSFTLQYFNHSEHNQSLYFLALSRVFEQKGQFTVAEHYLNKSMKKAGSVQNFELLDVIYSDYIRLSKETLSINPEVYIEKRRENQLKLQQLREIDDVLAVLIYRIKRSQNFSSQNSQVLELLQNTIQDFSGSIEIRNSPKLRFQIYHSLSRILLQQRDYVSLEKYLLQTLEEFSRENLFSKHNHDTRLQMLTYLGNALIKNEKLELALEYTQQLKEAMEAYDRVLYNKYLVYYLNNSSIAYSLLDRKAEAILLLDEALKDPKATKAVPHSRVVCLLNLALIYFDSGNFKKANRELARLKLEDVFQHFDKAFQLKIHLAELIVRFELKDFDYLEYLANQIRKQFQELLDSPDYQRQNRMLCILEKMVYSHIKSNEELLREVDELLNASSSEEAADTDILNYHDWLQSKK